MFEYEFFMNSVSGGRLRIDSVGPLGHTLGWVETVVGFMQERRGRKMAGRWWVSAQASVGKREIFSISILL
jgi:hypothetical protein